MKIIKILLFFVVLTCTFLIGMKAGPLLRQTYARINPPQLFSIGDYHFTDDSKTEMVIFSTSTCPYCKRLRSFLDAKKISYKDYVTDASDEAKSKYALTGEEVVPVSIVGQKKFVGFNDKIGRAIESSVMATR